MHCTSCVKHFHEHLNVASGVCAGNPIENLFGWVKCAFKDFRDDVEALDKDVPQICAVVRRLFITGGGEGRAYRWVRRCGYFIS